MSLENHLKTLISQTGPLTIAQFMHEALAHPEYGYYQKQDPFGKGGDFITAPEISQIFGELIGIWCSFVWQSMGSNKIALAELGPGRGTLMKDLLRGTKHVANFHNSIEIHMVETSPTLQQIQQENLSSSHHDINWHNDINSLPEKPLIIIANEFFDALPIHQYEKTDSGWRERLVGIDKDGELAFTLSTDVAGRGIHPFPTFIPFENPIRNEHEEGVNTPSRNEPATGSIIETCPQAINITRSLSTHIAKQNGAALFIDYGYAHYGYKDTLQAVKNHRYHPLLKDIGDADITAHVDFCAIAEAAKSAGVNASDVITQRNLLIALGIELRENALLKNASEQQKKDIKTATERLISPEEMGTLFKAIALYNKQLSGPVGF